MNECNFRTYELPIFILGFSLSSYMVCIKISKKFKTRYDISARPEIENITKIGIVYNTLNLSTREPVNTPLQGL